MRVPADQLPTPYPRRVSDGSWCRGAPSTTVQQSYSTQRVRLELPGGRVDLRPSGRAVPTPEVVNRTIPSTARVVLPISAAPGTQPRHREVEQQLAGLEDALVSAGTKPVPAFVTAPDRTWLEPAWCIHAPDVPALAQVAARHGVRALLLWHGERVSVRPVGHATEVPSLDYAVDVVRPSHCCPLRPDGDGPCVNVGGPWISASIHASAVFTAHRALLEQALGCGVCADQPRRRGPIALAGLLPPTREGGWSWARQE